MPTQREKWQVRFSRIFTLVQRPSRISGWRFKNRETPVNVQLSLTNIPVRLRDPDVSSSNLIHGSKAITPAAVAAAHEDIQLQHNPGDSSCAQVEAVRNCAPLFEQHQDYVYPGSSEPIPSVDDMSVATRQRQIVIPGETMSPRPAFDPTSGNETPASVLTGGPAHEHVQYSGETDIYQPLPKGSYIRVLELLPSAPLELRCQLVVKELTPDLRYEALSYTWGKTGHRKTIQCNGQPMDIGLNLFSALTTIVNNQRLRFIWADGICINQQDLHERAHQVGLMHRVYSNADRVLMFIGSDRNGEARAAFRLIRDIVDFYDAAHAELGSRQACQLSPPIDNEWSISWLHVNSLFEQAYFSRVWVQQEIALAKDASVVWGQHTIEWTYLVEFLIIYRLVRYLRQNFGCDVLEHLRIRFRYVWTTYLESTAWASKRPFMRSALENYSKAPHRQSEAWKCILSVLETVSMACIASDPRDYIFAFLGHPAAHLGAGKGAGLLATPDYSASVSQVCTEVARRLFVASQSLLMLSIGQEWVDADGKAQPSWVRRWDHRPSLPSSTFDFLRCRGFYFDVSMSSKLAKTEFCIQNDILSVTGMEFDDLVYCADSSPISSSIPLQDQMHPVKSIWLAIRRLWSEGDAPYKQLAAAYFCTLLVGVDKYSRPVDEQESFQYAIQVFLLSECGFTREELLEMGLTEYPHGKLKAHEIEAGLASYNLGFRKFFATSRGYIGMGPKGARAGDLCCVLFGGIAPFVLRPMDIPGQYRLMGECYVHGIMRGEAMKEFEAGKFNSQKFDIV